MKKAFIFMLVLLMLGLPALSVLAGDESHLMTMGIAPQDALLVGKVVDVTDEYIVFDLVRTVKGTPPEASPFRVTKTSARDVAFNAGDGILVSVQFLDEEKSTGKVMYGIYQVTLMRDKKIKMKVGDVDIGFVEWRVNTGIADYLYGQDRSVYWRETDGAEGKLLFDGTTWHVDTLDAKYTAPEVTSMTMAPTLSAADAQATTPPDTGNSLGEATSPGAAISRDGDPPGSTNPSDETDEDLGSILEPDEPTTGDSVGVSYILISVIIAALCVVVVIVGVFVLLAVTAAKRRKGK